MSKVSFIGLGVMGYPMAGYIAKAGHDVTVYNRTKSKAEKVKFLEIKFSASSLYKLKSFLRLSGFDSLKLKLH